MAQRNRTWQVLLIGLSLSGTAWAADLSDAQKAVRLRQFDKAYTLYQEVAESGNPEAQYQLAVLHLQGKGTRKDKDRAQQWLEKASEASHPGAQYLLSQLITNSDPDKALSLLSASAAQGYSAAQKQLERLGENRPRRATAEAPEQTEWFGAARKNDVAALERLQQRGFEVNAKDDAGRTALFNAIVTGADKAVDWLIKQGVDVSHRDKFGLTAAQTAIEHGQTKLLQKLLVAGADVKQTLENGDNLLHYAIRLDQTPAAELLLKQGVAVNHQNKDGWTPLDLAEYKKKPKLVAMLEAKGAKVGDGWRQGRQKVDASELAAQLDSDKALPPAARAVINSNEALLKTLLRQNPSSIDTVLPDGSTLLILAVKHNKLKMVDILLAEGAKVNRPAYRGVTALQVATRLENEDLVTRLLQAGANPLLRDDTGRDAVHSAIEEEQLNLAQRLLERALKMDGVGSPPVDEYLLLATQHHMNEAITVLLPHAGKLEAVDDAGRNALWFAAYESNIGLVGKLVKAGVNPAHRDDLGRSPFIIAVERGCVVCAKVLLPGNDINQQTDSGNTALIIAAQRKNAELTRWLVQNKANVEARNQRGNTALMEAVTANSIDVVRVLLDANASVTRKNKLGFSAIDLAQQVDPEILKLVRSKAVLGIF